MRGGLLLALLMGVGLMIYLFANNAETSIKAEKKVRDDMGAVTGRAEGGNITDSAEFTTDRAGLAVESVKAGSYYDVYFGLKQGDVIIQAGDMNLKGIDSTQAETFLMTAAQRKQDLVVQRQGQKVTLQAKAATVP